jgi:hypothetical protein
MNILRKRILQVRSPENITYSATPFVVLLVEKATARGKDKKKSEMGGSID